MQDQNEIIKTMAVLYQRAHHPEKAAKTASAADQALEFRRATERGRRIMRGETPEVQRGRETMQAIKESQAGKRGLKSFPPARQVVK